MPLVVAAPVALEAPAARSPHLELGDLQVGVGVGFDGVTWDPGSLFNAWVGWWELRGQVELAVYQIDDLVMSVGAEAWLARPFVQELRDPVPHRRFRLTEQGLALRSAMTYTRLRSFEPYAVAVFGPDFGSLVVRDTTTDTAVVARRTAGGVRLAAGGGVLTRLTDDLLGSLELRYIVGYPAPHRRSVDVPLPEGSYAFSTSAAPPRGFAYTFTVAWRR